MRVDIWFLATVATLTVAPAFDFGSVARAADGPQPAAPASPDAGAAAQPAKPLTWQKMCEGDVKKLCMEAVKTNTVPQCLAAHEKDLSQGCSDVFLWKYKITQLCKEDIETHCKDAAATGGLGKCFKEKEKSLSEKCRNALSRGSKRFQVEEKKADKDEKAAASAGPSDKAAAPADATTPAEAPKKATPKRTVKKKKPTAKP